MSRRPVVISWLISSTQWKPRASSFTVDGIHMSRTRMLRLAGEAVVGRIGDAAAKLRDQVGDELPGEVPWDDVVASRIIVDYVYHRVDYEAP